MPRATVILPDEPLPAQEFAARELLYHVRIAAGVELPLCRESDRPAEAEFAVYVGPCSATGKAGIDVDALPPAGYVVRTFGNCLFLAGRDRDRGSIGHYWTADWQGTLYAVYDFLETEMGVRWLWPGELGEYIPGRSRLAVRPTDRSGKPRFRQAWLRPVGARGSHIPGWSSPEAKERFHEAQKLFLIRHRFGAVENLDYGHSFGRYWRRFGKSNPEFFAQLPDGARRPLDGDPGGNSITMCVSAPSLWKQVIADWERNSERDPEHVPYRPYVNACENDTPGMCTCARCRSWDAPHPAFELHDYWGKEVTPSHSSERWKVAPQPPLSDRYARYYAEVLREARKVDPTTRVAGYAYSNYHQPPSGTDIDLSGVIILHVPPMGSKGLWIPYTEEKSSEFRKSWDGWSRLGAEMVFRPNLTHTGANLPVFYARQLAADFSYAADHGMVGTYFDSLLGAWSAQGPTMYTLARIHQHPEWSTDRILDEYYAAFGPAEAGVRKYFGYWERHSGELAPEDIRRYEDEEKGGSFKNYVRIAHRLFSPENFADARALLGNARRQAGRDELALRRVSYLEQGLTDAELTTATRAAQVRMERDGNAENKAAFAAAFQRLAEYRTTVMEAGGDHPANLGYFAFREQTGAGWPHMPRPGEEELKRESAFQARWPDKPSPDPAKQKLVLVGSRALSRTDWMFRKDSERSGDLQGWHRPETPVADWQTVDISKAWASFLGEPYIGSGWYRRHIEIPEPLDGRSVYLQFGGIDESCWLWVNETYVGRHHIGPKGWDISFRLDITPALRPGKNLVTVRAMNTVGAGGIWRPVRLEFYRPRGSDGL